MDITEYVLIFLGLAAFAVQAIFNSDNLRRYGMATAFTCGFALLIKGLVETAWQDTIAWVFLTLFLGYRLWIVWNETKGMPRISNRLPSEDR